jgi:hypothetical protein
VVTNACTAAACETSALTASLLDHLDSRFSFLSPPGGDDHTRAFSGKQETSTPSDA